MTHLYKLQYYEFRMTHLYELQYYEYNRIQFYEFIIKYFNLIVQTNEEERCTFSHKIPHRY